MSTTTTQSATTPAPATVPASQVIPFPLPWGNIPGCAPGCVPAGGMDALMKCYMDIKAAMAFISKVMIDLINNDPAVAQAMIAAIEKSGSSIPQTGVTNGVAAQPGQVGEFIILSQSLTVPATAQTVTVSMGVLQPGDWDVQGYAVPNEALSEITMLLNPQPAGFSNDMWSKFAVGEASDVVTLVTPVVQALISVPTLVAIEVSSNTSGTGGSAGTVSLYFFARRMR